MPTPYSAVHERLLSKISDYDILAFIDVEREELLRPYLMSACVQFGRVCKVDLSDRDDIIIQFNADLNDEIIEILAIGECYYWLCPKVLNSENLRNALNTKDYQVFSPEKLLGRLQSLRNDLKKEFKQAIIDYSYNTSSLADLKG